MRGKYREQKPDLLSVDADKDEARPWSRGWKDDRVCAIAIARKSLGAVPLAPRSARSCERQLANFDPYPDSTTRAEPSWGNRTVETCKPNGWSVLAKVDIGFH